MTTLQQQLALAQRMIANGVDHAIVAQALTQILIDNYGLPVNEAPVRRVCRNTFIPEFTFQD
jgi:SLT domain-containing protein